MTDKIIGRWRNKQRNKTLGAWAPGHYTKVGISDTMGSTKTTIEGNTDTMNCTIKPHHGHHRWNIDSRKDLERLWNANIHPKGGAFLSIRQFALSYGFPPSSLYEELTHGFVSKVLKDFNGRRFIYPEYSAEKAQKRATHEAAQKGRRGKVTTNLAKKLVVYLEKGFSVTTCLAELKAQGWKHLPCERTVYYHRKLQRPFDILLPQRNRLLARIQCAHHICRGCHQPHYPQNIIER